MMKSYSHSFVHKSVLTNLGVALVFTMFLITHADGQDAAARKALVETVRQDVVKKMGTNLAPGYNITAEGPDATLYVYHQAGVTSSGCVTMLTEGHVKKLRDTGFTKLICTDDRNTTFTFDPIAQPVAARQSFVENARQGMMKSMGPNLYPGSNTTAEGPDATFYVYHQADITSSACSGILSSESFTTLLQGMGFTNLVCTDDKASRFTLDLSPQPPATPQPHWAQDAKPTDAYRIKADVLGEPMAVYQQNNPEDCLNNADNPLKHKSYAGTFYPSLGMCVVFGQGSDKPVSNTVWMTYAGAVVKQKTVRFQGGRFVHLTYTVTHTQYTQVRDALVEKFGEPSIKSDENLQNRMGAQFTGQLFTWDNGASSILLKEYLNAEESSVTFVINDYLEQLKKLRRDAPKKAAASDM